MIFVILIILIPLLIYLYFVRIQSYENRIYDEIEALGGKVIDIERRNFFTGIGPFHVVGKNRVVFRIVYEINGVEKEGWVRFGGIMGPDWRLDE